MTSAIRIASWNIRKALGTDRKRHPERIVAILETLHADIMVLQEVDYRLGTRKPALPLDLIKEAGFSPVNSHPVTPSLGWHGNAILLRKGMRLAQSRLIDLPGLEPRGALWAEVQSGQGPVRIIGVHLGLMRRSRLAQLSHLAREIDRHDRLPTIMIGDFNERSATRGFEPLAKSFEVISAGPTFHARLPHAALDRIAHNALIELDHVKAVHTSQTRLASDHLPIVAEVRLASAPS